MMDVNLLPDQSIEAQKDLKRKGIAITVILIAIGITVALLIAGNSYKIYQDNQIASLKEKKGLLTNEIQAKADVATKLLTLKKKAKGLSAVEANKYDFRNAFGYITDFLPEGIDLENVKINSAGEVIVKVASGDQKKAADYIEQIATDPKLRDPAMVGLQMTEDGIIRFSLGGGYGKSKQAKE